MSYLIMECHLSYAIALDEQGRFIKTANMGYEVGQRVENILEPENRNSKRTLNIRRLSTVTAAAACLCLMLLGSFRLLLVPQGTVRMKINPEVEITVNRWNYVTDLEGGNEDGSILAADVKTFGKKIDVLVDELADKAVEMGYLQEGGRIALMVDSANDAWKRATEEMLVIELEIHFQNKIQVDTINTQDSQTQDAGPFTNMNPENNTIIIPAVPEQSLHDSKAESTQGKSDDLKEAGRDDDHDDRGDDRNDDRDDGQNDDGDDDSYDDRDDDSYDDRDDGQNDDGDDDSYDDGDDGQNDDGDDDSYDDGDDGQNDDGDDDSYDDRDDGQNDDGDDDSYDDRDDNRDDDNGDNVLHNKAQENQDNISDDSENDDQSDGTDDSQDDDQSDSTDDSQDDGQNSGSDDGQDDDPDNTEH